MKTENEKLFMWVGIGIAAWLFLRRSAAADPHAMGLVAPTDADRAWMDQNMTTTEYPIPITAIGLDRLNFVRASAGQDLLDPAYAYQWDSADSISRVQQLV